MGIESPGSGNIREALAELMFEADDLLLLTAHEFLKGDMVNRELVAFIGGGPLPVSPMMYAVYKAYVDSGPARYNRFIRLLKLAESSVAEESALLAFMHGELKSFVRDELVPGSGFVVLSVDKEDAATEAASNLLLQSGLKGLIHPVTGDGQTACFEVTPALFIIASMAVPKCAILRNLLRSANGRIVEFLVRSVVDGDLREILYEPFSTQEIDSLCFEHPGLAAMGVWEPEKGSRCINSFVRLERVE